jgi:hypothetical protein
VCDPRDAGCDALLHHALNVPLFSHFQESPEALFNRCDAALLHELLQSPTWHKGLFARAHVAEMTFLGIPYCTYLPLAADSAAYPQDTPRVDYDGPLVFFADFQPSRCFDDAHNVEAHVLRSGLLALAAVADGTADSFINAYTRYDLGPQPAPNADAAERAACAETYFDHKRFHATARNLGTRDRFIMALSRRLGDRFCLVGNANSPELCNARSNLALNETAYDEAIRQTPICLNLARGADDTGLNQRAFEITARGGLLLQYQQPDLSEQFEIGSECVAFRNEAELFDRIRHLMENRKHRDEIARAGQLRTLREHQLHHRVKAIVTMLREHGRLQFSPSNAAAEMATVCN